jgi:hypothetical protein
MSLYVGMVMVAWPLLSGRAKETSLSVSERSQAYTTSKNLLINGADAVERIMTSYKEVTISYYGVYYDSSGNGNVFF